MIQVTSEQIAIAKQLDDGLTIARKRNHSLERFVRRFSAQHKLRLAYLGGGASCNAYLGKHFKDVVLKCYFDPIMGDNVPPMIGAVKEHFLYPLWMGTHIMLQAKVINGDEWHDQENTSWHWWEKEKNRLRRAVNRSLKRFKNIKWSDSHSDNVGMLDGRMFIIDWNYTDYDDGKRPRLSPKVKKKYSSTDLVIAGTCATVSA